MRWLFKRNKKHNILYTKDIFRKEGYEIGDYTYGHPTVFFSEGAHLKIGKFCSISPEVRIFLGGNHRTEWWTTYPFPDLQATYNLWPDADGISGHPSSNGDVVIGNDVWIGYQAIILSGISIGDGAVIGARSIVTKNVEPYAVVAGNPARVIRKRFDENTIKKLLELGWWNWPIDKINQKVKSLCSAGKLEELAGNG